MQLSSYMNGDVVDIHSSPFATKGKSIHIPREYEELMVDYFDDISNIPNTNKQLEKVCYAYSFAFWMENWYDKSMEYTPHSEMVKLEDLKGMSKFDPPKFVRLSGLSPKYKKQVTSGEEALHILEHSERCQNEIKLAKELLGITDIFVFLRDWVDMEKGYEFRCFVYHNKLCAICSNDNKWIEQPDSHLYTPEIIEKRCNEILLKCKRSLPFHNCVMDVFLGKKEDILVEFNPFGGFAGTGPGLFHWNEDDAILKGLGGVAVKLNRDILQQ